jgi:hypothetical protein
MDQKKRKWYLYHLEGDKIVMDHADHTDHHRQARHAMGLEKPRYVAGTLAPLSKEEMERYEKHYKASFDHSKRKDLPEFVEPPHWEKLRARHAEARKKNEVSE